MNRIMYQEDGSCHNNVSGSGVHIPKRNRLSLKVSSVKDFGIFGHFEGALFTLKLGIASTETAAAILRTLVLSLVSPVGA